MQAQIKLQGTKAEWYLKNYIEYAAKQGEIQLVNVGNQKLIRLYEQNLNFSRHKEALRTNHNSMCLHLSRYYAEEQLVLVNGNLVRRSKLVSDSIPYTELQDQMLGDFVFVDKVTNQLIVVDCTTINGYDTNATKIVYKKMLKLKKRCFLFKALAAEVVGKGSMYLSIVWNNNTYDDLLDSIRQWHQENALLRSQYTKAKTHNSASLASILTKIHVKTNVELDNLAFTIPSNIW